MSEGMQAPPSPPFLSQLTADHTHALGFVKQAGSSAVADDAALVCQPAMHAQHAGAQVRSMQVKGEQATEHLGVQHPQPAGAAGSRRGSRKNTKTRGK
jgi:hypothetical protein